MCSVDDAEISGEAFMPLEKGLIFNDSSKCRRCLNAEACVILKRKDVYCKTCFLAYVTHKFRATLGKSKVMKPADNVLVAFSGGQSSVALLHMLWAGTKEDDHKKLLYKVIACYIDDGSITEKSIEERRRMILENKLLVESYGFIFHATTLSSSLSDTDPLLNEPLLLNSADDSALKDLFKQLQSLTAKEDLLLKLKQRLLVNVARKLNCNKLFTAEGQTSLAVKLLTSIALGRGEQLSLEVGFEDSRYADVLILRPMRDIEKKEVSYYNQFHSLKSQDRLSLTTGMSSTASVRRLTQEFINGLQQEFPSTVSTVFRTGEKLSTSRKTHVDSEKVCLLCNGSCFDSREGEEGSYSAVDATAFSRVVSRPSKNAQPVLKNGCCGNCSCAQPASFTEDELRGYFCYGCLLIVREMESMNLLPLDLLAEMSRRKNLKSMREQIADFLL